jgi:hypothetical protein
MCDTRLSLRGAKRRGNAMRDEGPSGLIFFRRKKSSASEKLPSGAGENEAIRTNGV